jgi:deferrochelatase/peroxidase EfeB
MDARSVNRQWGLAPDVAKETQGIVATGFGSLKTGRALMLSFGWSEPPTGAGAWLSALREVAPITDAIPSEKAPSRSAALAISWSGLSLMGLSETALRSFSLPFQEGMFQEDRLRRLGDRRRDWTSTVIKGGPLWSANTPPQPPIDPLPIGFHVPDPAPDHPLEPTQYTVHAVLLLYAKSDPEIRTWTDAVEAALAPHKVTIVRTRELLVDVMGQDTFAREHFGFADGLSQPLPYDPDGSVVLGSSAVTNSHPVQGVPLGEILFGHLNGHGEKAPGPIAPDTTGIFGSVPDPRKAGLKPRPDAEGFFDLGRNGSYLVVRELKQDVAQFWTSMKTNANRLRQQDPTHLGAIDAQWVAERTVGRDIDGNLLCPGGVLPPLPDGSPDNDFKFWQRDQYGHGCPLGSHVRRANPRDALSPDEKQREGILRSANNHRILRRGRKFGKAISDRHTDDGEDRGLLFMCLNTDLARQFEFIQQTWLLNSSFSHLYGEVDPLIGPDGPMTVYLDNDPLRLVPQVETYVHFVGGDYYFLPSLPALRYLEAL